jgi:hypothetical protein
VLHLGKGGGALAPVVNVRSARLDRQRQAQRPRDPCGGGAIGIEELRVDDVEGVSAWSRRASGRTLCAISAGLNRPDRPGSSVKRGWYTGTPLRVSIGGMA